MTKKFTDRDNKKSNDYIKEIIETEYIGGEETEYIHAKTGKIPKNIILNQRYKIVATIGKGGMGAVYKAMDMRLKNILVAIKEISLETIEDERIEKVIQNFENEASTLISLRHNAIPRVMDFFSLDNNKCYIVMDLIDGETLDEVIKQRGKIPENEVRDWISQLADVLKYLHTREPKVIFRDLKPSNVMLTKDNQIKLIDFGIARTFKDNKSTDTTYYVSQGFSPPEQYGTGQSDERSDVYSLGALAYSLLIGGKPKIKNFEFDNLKDTINISEEFNEAIIKATNFRPENRPQSVDEFMDIAKPRLKDIVPKRKNKKIIIGSITLIIIAGAVFAYSVSKSNESEKYKSNTNLGDNTKQASNIDEDNPNVKKAIQTLYNVTKDSKAYTIYELNNGDSYVKDPRVKQNYYIFNISGPEGSLSDFNYAVNKNDYSVYVCTTGGLVIPYKDYNTDTKLGKYYTDYGMMGDSNIPETTKKYLEENGAEALNTKVNEIMKNALPATIEHCNGPVLYVDAILRGAKKQELDKEAFVYTESEYNVDTFLNGMFTEYERAVSAGDPSIMYPYVTPDGESHKQYSEAIPKYHEKGITVKLLGNEINERKVDSNGDCIITATTDFEITNKNGTRTQKEKADYVIKRISNTEFALDRIENWSIVK